MPFLRIVVLSIAYVSVAVSVSWGFKAETPDQTPKEDLEIFALLRSPEACIGADHLSARIIVINRGEVPVELDLSRLSLTFGFVALIDIAEMKFRHEAFSSSYDRIGQAPPAVIAKLPAHGFLERGIEIPFHSAPTDHAGFYKINISSSVRVNQTTGYRDVFASSGAIFELHSCDAR